MHARQHGQFRWRREDSWKVKYKNGVWNMRMGGRKCKMCWERRPMKNQNFSHWKEAGKANGFGTRSQSEKVIEQISVLLGVQSWNAWVNNGQKSPEVVGYFCWTVSGLLILVIYLLLANVCNYTVFLFSLWGRTKTVHYYYCFLCYSKWPSDMFKSTCRCDTAQYDFSFPA